VAALYLPKRALAGPGKLDIVAAKPEPRRDDLRVVAVVIDDEDAASCGCGFWALRFALHADGGCPGQLTCSGKRSRRYPCTGTEPWLPEDSTKGAPTEPVPRTQGIATCRSAGLEKLVVRRRIAPGSVDANN